MTERTHRTWERRHESAEPSPPGGAADEPSDHDLIDAVARATGTDTRDVRLEKTHASRVVIAGGRAFKFKRRVDLGFLDFRSLESRRRAGEDEVRLNRRLAPEVYLGLAPVARGAGGDWRIGDVGRSRTAGRDGDAADWCVVMRELPAERMLDHLLDRDELRDDDLRDLDDLVRRIARFHRSAGRGPEIAEFGSPARRRERLERNLEGVARAASVSPSTIAFLASRARELLEATLPVLEARRARGCVIDGHGDLHCGNICMVPGGAIAYDCLEFSQALRVRDTSEELAFLAMDLEARGRADVAERVMRVYLDEARRDPATAEREVDFEAPQRWFRLSDALVRAMVDSLRAGRGEGTANTAAHRDVDLACGHALEPLFVLMCGLPGSGKSTVARALARPLRADVIRSDEVRKELAGIAPTERGDAAIYAAEMTERVYDELVARARRALDAGRHVILDAAFPSRALRARAIERLADGERQAGRGPVGGWILVECTARKPELQRRLEARSREPRDVSDADESVMRLMATRFEPPDELAAAHRIQVDSADAAVPHRVVERLATTATTE